MVIVSTKAESDRSKIPDPIRLPIATCGVYVFYDTEGDVIYIGRSFTIVYRRLGAAISRFSQQYDLSHIDFFPCNTNEEAHKLEGELIVLLDPFENVQRLARNMRIRNRMTEEQEKDLRNDIRSVVKRHGTTMKRVNRIMQRKS